MASVSPAPASAPASKPRIQLDTLTGVRGIACMMVFLTHSGMEPVFANSQINHTIVEYCAALGEAAVSFFFMLSGFVLVWATKPGDTKAQFWRRRIVKIYPNTVVTWTAGLILMIIAGEFTSAGNVLPSLALIHVWIPIEGVIQGTDGPAWSLSCEVFFYALFPFLLLAIRRIRTANLWRWVIGLALLMLAVTVLVGVIVPSEPKALGQDVSLYQFYVLIFLPPIRLIDFVLGMLLCRILLENRMPPLRWSWVGIALAAGWAVSTIVPAPLGFVVPLIIANVLLVGKAALTDTAGERSVLNHRVLVWLGDISFAFYLIHWLVLHFGRVFLGGGPWSTPVALGFLTGALVLSLVLAHLLRAYVEIPMMRRWARPRRTPAPEPQASIQQDSGITPPSVSAAVE